MAADPEVIEGEATSLAVIESRSMQPANLFGVDDPIAVLERATSIAKALADVIDRQRLFSTIQGRKHVTVEGWTLLGSMLGVFPRIEWTRECTDGWEARCLAVTRNGEVVGAGEAMCTRTENTWKGRDAYALRAMAQTRAISRALRGPLDFIVKLAGYASAPAEEMTEVPERQRVQRQIDPQAPPHGSPPSRESARRASEPPAGSAPPRARTSGNTITIKRQQPEADPSKEAASLRDIVLRRAMEIKRAQAEKDGEIVTEAHLKTAATESILRVFEKALADMTVADLESAALKLGEFLTSMGREVPV